MCEGTCPRDRICPLHEMWRACQEKVIAELSASNFAELGARHLELVNQAQRVNKRKTGAIPDSILSLVPANGNNG